MFRKEHFYQAVKYLTGTDRLKTKAFYPYGTFAECSEYCKSMHPAKGFYHNPAWKKLIDDECKDACEGQAGTPTPTDVKSSTTTTPTVVKSTTTTTPTVVKSSINLTYSKVIEDNVRKIILRWSNITDCGTEQDGYYGLYYYDSNLRNIDNMNVKYIECGKNQIKFRIKDGYTEYQKKDELFLEKNKKYKFHIFVVNTKFEEIVISKEKKLVNNEIEITV